MRRTPFLTAVALVATLFIVSCKNGGKSDLKIPRDAAMVFHINTSSLTSKLSWKEIKESQWFKEAYQKENDSFAKAIMDNPEASGVDMKGDFAFFMRKHGANGGYIVFEGKLKNADDFAAAVKKMTEGKPVKKSGDLNYVENSASNILSWNKNTFIVMSDAPFMSQAAAGPFGRRMDDDQSKITPDSLVKFTKALLDLDKDDALEDDDRFGDLLETKGDVHMWVNSEQYMGNLGGMMSMLKLGDLLKGNVSTATLSFDDGQITMKSKQYYGKEMAKLMDKYEPKDVEASVINRIPSQNVLGVLAFNFDPAGAKEFIKAMGLDGMANAYLGQLDMTLDELISATGGQFLMSVSDFNVVKKEVTVPPYYEGGQPYTYTNTTPEFKMLVASSVGNKSSFDKLMTIAKQRMGATDTTLNYKVNNQWFVAGNNAQSVDQFLAGGNNKVPFADKISGNSFGMYIDLQKIFSAARNANAFDSTLYPIVAATWQDIVGTGGDYKNGSSTGEFVVNFVDKKTNSLKQLNQFAEKMHAAAKERSKRFENDQVIMPPNGDSITEVVPAPVQDAPKEQR